MISSRHVFLTPLFHEINEMNPYKLCLLEKTYNSDVEIVLKALNGLLKLNIIEMLFVI